HTRRAVAGVTSRRSARRSSLDPVDRHPGITPPGPASDLRRTVQGTAAGRLRFGAGPMNIIVNGRAVRVKLRAKLAGGGKGVVCGRCSEVIARVNERHARLALD